MRLKNNLKALWLYQHGGRDESDIVLNENEEECVEMVLGRDKRGLIPIPV